MDLLVLPCSLFSVSQNFCSSLKYLSRMKTFERPMVPAVVTADDIVTDTLEDFMAQRKKQHWNRPFS